VDYNYNTADQFDNYQVSTIKADSGGGTTTNTYDVNGHLISVDDGKETGVRKFFVDTAGHILRKEQKGDNTYSLLVNDQLIGTSSKDYLTDSINQSYIKQSALSGNGPSMYITQQGDTLQSIAKTVWGDATLWYLIADANG
ncbi:LysM peptidoglycan-binding domain-containing protein, partial [Undibacterium sp. Di27W]|uniref:LysM peptidoglycan-binding domain-containing protein n=1 Tax=Undibacterium sp. Di27W TaxID=3413036 RepID=UPI003BF01100